MIDDMIKIVIDPVFKPSKKVDEEREATRTHNKPNKRASEGKRVGNLWGDKDKVKTLNKNIRRSSRTGREQWADKLTSEELEEKERWENLTNR